MAPLRLAPLRLALLQVGVAQVGAAQVALLRSASLRMAPLRLAPLRMAPLRMAPIRLAPRLAASAPLRDGVAHRHEPTPCSRNIACKSMSYVCTMLAPEVDHHPRAAQGAGDYRRLAPLRLAKGIGCNTPRATRCEVSRQRWPTGEALRARIAIGIGAAQVVAASLWIAQDARSATIATNPSAMRAAISFANLLVSSCNSPSKQACRRKTPASQRHQIEPGWSSSSAA